jgi:hypothetical protein
MNGGPASSGARLSVRVATCPRCEVKQRRETRWLPVVLLARQGQNRHFLSHFVLPSSRRTRVATAASPPGTGLFRRRWSLRVCLLAMEREGQGLLLLSLSRPSSPNPTRVSLPQTLAAAAGSSRPHPLPVGHLDPGRFQPHPPHPATSALSESEQGAGVGVRRGGRSRRRS